MRPQFGMYRIQWPDGGGIEYHLAHGDWIALLRENGFEIEALHELRPPRTAVDARATTSTSRSSGRTKWPAEEIWVARKRMSR